MYLFQHLILQAWKVILKHVNSDRTVKQKLCLIAGSHIIVHVNPGQCSQESKFLLTAKYEMCNAFNKF